MDMKSSLFPKPGILSRLFGKKLYCPVCETTQYAFLPLPANYEADAKRYGYMHFGMSETMNVEQYSCAKCGASDRERLFALYFSKRRESGLLPEQTKLLHFAPERAFSAFLEEMRFADYRTADLGGSAVDDQVDIVRMQRYRDGEWDVFICSHVLEHVLDDRSALQELYRVLKPGGWGIIMVPLMTHFELSLEDAGVVDEAERYRFYGQGDHVRLYARKDFLARIEQAGFMVEPLGAEYFGADVYSRCGITSRSTLYIVTKPT